VKNRTSLGLHGLRLFLLAVLHVVYRSIDGFGHYDTFGLKSVGVISFPVMPSLVKFESV
jgi:hypothetical protein